MSKINKLDPSVYNLISAGEVVENPASVVKELVDNSIDAGASEITISIQEGGIKSISILDNGSGMSKDDLYLSYLPHATSKLKNAIDLSNISTLGFRGEALASIAAVSHLTIASNQESNEGIGYKIKVSGGKIEEESECGMTIGTEITVDNLFYNTPVRLKFLKTPKQEESLVKNKVIALIFSNPDVKFKFIVDGEVELQTSGGLEDVIYEIYGTEISNKLVPFDITYSGYRAYGFTSLPELAKHNKSFETVIVNGRPIQNQNIALAVMQAYGTTLMKRTFPVYVLNLVIPFDEVDVNVHPTKLDVRFSDNHKVFSTVYRGICQALDNQAKTLDLTEISKTEQTFETKNEQQKQTYVQNQNEQTFKPYYASEISYEINSNSYINNAINENSKLENSENSKDIENSKLENSQIKANNLFENNNNSNIDISKIIRSDIYDSQDILNNINNSKIDDFYPKYKVIGQLFDTYLIIQDDDKAYLIDQHACHEKDLYEKLINSMNKREVVSQPLLIPFIYETNASQYDYMLMLMDNLKDLGFDIEEFGNLTFKVNEIPAFLVDINLSKFFEELLCEKSTLQQLKNSDLFKEKLAQYACKSAIKGGDSLSEAQIRELFKQMKNGIPTQCPHGRPCIFTYTKNDLDKLFKRIE